MVCGGINDAGIQLVRRRLACAVPIDPGRVLRPGTSSSTKVSSGKRNGTLVVGDRKGTLTAPKSWRLSSASWRHPIR
jgi:hypothetical protein